MTAIDYDLEFLEDGRTMWTHDIQQEAARLGLAEEGLPRQESGLHNALADARHNQVVRRFLRARAEGAR